MFLRILKKDIRRKKTMNVILLLFVILSAMFAASSVNNIITVVGGTDYFFEQAGMADYYFITIDGKNGDTLSPKLEAEPAVSGFRREGVLYTNAEKITVDGKKAMEFSNSSILLMSVDGIKINYFDKNNDALTEVPEGSFYMSGSAPENSGIKIGDKLDFSLGDVTVSLEYRGRIKDALLGSDFMGNARVLLNSKDYAKFYDDPSTEGYRGSVFYVDTNDTKAVEEAVTDDVSIAFDGSHSVIKMTYVLEVITTGMLLVVSVALILISFVILRFTIGFTITEEFREIGVMKAIGIKNRHIRALYLVKYLGIAIIGAVLGYFVSIPFGNLLLESASKSMYLGNDSNVLIGSLSCAAIVGIIMLFCWGCTRKIKKLSPIDAVRNGQTGERFKKRSFMNLGKSKLPATGFLAVNDVVSAPKQYSIMTVVFTLCLLLVMVFANIANTLGGSDKMLFLLGNTKSDLYYSSKDAMDLLGGVRTIEEHCSGIEKELADLGMPAKVHIEGQYKVPVEFGGTRQNITALWSADTKCSDYVYERGTAPQNENEFAATTLICDKFGFDIGDKAKITVNGVTKEYLLTAVFQSMNQLGQVIRLHEDAPLADVTPGTTFPAQIDFDDHPDAKTIEERKEFLKDHWDTDKVQNVTEFVKESTNSADAIAAVKNLVLIISVMIIIMIVVLMERSFIAKEKAELALMKALGIKDRYIIGQHTFRFVIVAAVSGLLSAALCLPLTKLVADPIFGMMGASEGIGYELNVPEIFALYPAIILAAVIAAARITAILTKAVKASDAANIE
ncbi:MAG: ABC transporter permease [Ruminococcus sp.]|nr:ABC transporter permease [Ruminococcus sp.]